MPTYTFEAVNSKGDHVRDDIEASSQDEALSKIHDLGLFPKKIREKTARRTAAVGATAKKKRSGPITFGGVSNKQLCQFTRQLATLQDAGLPLVRSLKILEGQMQPCKLKEVLSDVADDVESGNSFSESLEKHPKAFDKLYVNMIRAGEVGGVLDTILERLADFKEKARKLKSKIVGAMIYPAAVVFVATSILIVIMVYIVPQFEKIFKQMGSSLPPVTTALISIATFLQEKLLFIIPIPIALFIIYKVINSTNGGKYFMDSVKLHLPIFGVIIRKSTISQFARTLGTLIASGVPILEALNIVRGTTGNEVIARAIGQVHDSIREGDTIAEPLRASGVVDELVVNMIDVGEETGELDKMLNKVADTYDDEVDTLVSGMMSLMEPVIIVGLGGAVAFIVIALFLPLVKLMENISDK